MTQYDLLSNFEGSEKEQGGGGQAHRCCARSLKVAVQQLG